MDERAVWSILPARFSNGSASRDRAKHSPPKGQKVVGYIVDFKVNARNQFGGATGKQKYQVVIRNGEILWGGRPRS